MTDADPSRPGSTSSPVLKRRTVVTIILFSTLAFVAVGAAYIGSFYLLYYGALQKDAMYGLYYIERGNYRNCSLITQFYPEDKDVWPFTARQFSDVYHPLIWWHMKQRRRTSEPDGRIYDLSQTRQHCIDRGVDARLFDGDLVIVRMRNGPVVMKADYFGFSLIANLAP